MEHPTVLATLPGRLRPAAWRNVHPTLTHPGREMGSWDRRGTVEAYVIARDHPRVLLFLTSVAYKFSGTGSQPEWTFNPQAAALYLQEDLAVLEARTWPGSRVLMQQELLH